MNPSARKFLILSALVSPFLVGCAVPMAAGTAQAAAGVLVGLGAIGFGATVLAEHSVQGHLFPVRGPLSANAPLPSFDLTLKFHGGGEAGTLESTLTGNTSCKGPYQLVGATDPAASSLAAEWNQVYGDGYFVANVLGSHSLAGGQMKCAFGNVSVQFVVFHPGDMALSRGVAKDEAGNLYKVTF